MDCVSGAESLFGLSSYIPCIGMSVIDSHFIFILFLVVGSLAAIFSVESYYRKLFANWVVLAVAFAFISLMALSELLEYTQAAPGVSFWHYAHLALGIASLYFLECFLNCRYASCGVKGMAECFFEAKVPQDLAALAVRVFLIAVLIAAFTYGSTVFGGQSNPSYDFIAFMALIILGTYLLVRILRAISELEAATQHALSLKVFLILSTTGFIVLALYVALISLGVSGLAETQGDAFYPVQMVAYALHSMFYVVIFSVLAFFSYGARKVETSYSPLLHFLGKAGTVTEAPPMPGPQPAPAPKRTARRKAGKS